MDAQIDPIVSQVDAFGVQASALFGTGRAVGWQAQVAAGGDHPVPGQARIGRQLAEGAADPARRATEAGEGGQLAIAD